MSARTTIIKHDFRGQHLFPLAASGAGSAFVIADTSAAGAPTVKGSNTGGVALTLAATSEVENLCLYQGDVLPYDIDDIIRLEFIVKTLAALDAGTSIAFGVADARNDAIDTIATAALFRLIGNNNIVIDSDDGTNEKNQIATGETLGATFKRFAIDFATGMQTREPPLLSLGGKSNIQFFGGNANGSLRRLAQNTAFDMSAYSVGLQLYFQISKTATTAVDSLTVLECSVELKLPNA